MNEFLARSDDFKIAYDYFCFHVGLYSHLTVQKVFENMTVLKNTSHIYMIIDEMSDHLLLKPKMRGNNLK